MLSILFLCTGNSGRSILAEALMNRLGEGRFKAYSAGSAPKGEVNPHVFPATRALGFPDDAFHSKPWEAFAGEGAPKLDFVITVCDHVADEACPIWPGQPISAHWGIADPARVGRETGFAAAFGATEAQLRGRIERLLALPVDRLDRPTLQARLREIGAESGEGG